MLTPMSQSKSPRSKSKKSTVQPVSSGFLKRSLTVQFQDVVDQVMFPSHEKPKKTQTDLDEVLNQGGLGQFLISKVEEERRMARKFKRKASHRTSGLLRQTHIVPQAQGPNLMQPAAGNEESSADSENDDKPASPMKFVPTKTVEKVKELMTSSRQKHFEGMVKASQKRRILLDNMVERTTVGTPTLRFSRQPTKESKDKAFETGTKSRRQESRISGWEHTATRGSKASRQISTESNSVIRITSSSARLLPKTPHSRVVSFSQSSKPPLWPYLQQMILRKL